MTTDGLKRDSMADSYQGDVEALLRDNPQALAEFARFPDMNPGPVLRADLDANVLMANRAARDLFGDDVAGRSWTEVCPHVAGEPWKRVIGSDALVTIEAQSDDRDFAFTRTDGTAFRRWCSCMAPTSRR